MDLPLSNGETALIDDDCGYLLNWSWQRDVTGYPSRGGSHSGKKCHLRLHAVIMGRPPKGLVTDHVNGNKLDNRRENLRWASKRLNTLNNQRTSGVSWHESDKAWRVRFSIRSGGERRELYFGNFSDKQEALSVAALLKGALIYHELTKGEFSGQ